MRLADQIIESAHHPLTPIDRDFLHWVPKLQAARCFEIDPSAGEISQATMSTNPARASIRTRDTIALPAQTCWFECLGPSAGMGPRANEPPRPGTVVPHRCGVLVEADASLRRGLMSWVWNMLGAPLEPCPISVTFDWRAVPDPVPDIVRASFIFHGVDWEQRLREFHGSSRFASQEFEPFAAEESRYGHVPCPGLPTLWSTLEIVSRQDMTRVQEICAGALRDLEVEPLFVLGLVAGICAPGLFDVGEPADTTRLNAARRKRRRTELLSFRRISASGRNVIRLTDRGGPLEAMRAVLAA